MPHENIESNEGPSQSSSSEEINYKAYGAKIIKGALVRCLPSSCEMKRPRNELEKKSNEILSEIEKDDDLKTAFLTCLKEYNRQSGISMLSSGTPAGDFYKALEIIGNADQENTHLHLWENILRVAEQSVTISSEKWPYDRLKVIINSVVNKKE